MKWRKLGRVFLPDGTRPWARSYAHLPTPLALDASRIRVYYSSLDEHQYGRVGFVEVDAREPTRVLYESPDPVLDLGELGTFDDCGVTPSCALVADGVEWLYYIGWQRAERVPYMLFTGLARRTGGVFERVSRVPVLDRTDDEPFSRSAPQVLPPGPGSPDWVVWYWTCIRWEQRDGQVHYRNEIRRAVSPDGRRWTVDPEVSIGPQSADDYAAGRPWAPDGHGSTTLLFSMRGHEQPYRIVYATRAAGGWTYGGTAPGLEVGGDAWESDMCAYPATVDAAGRRLLFYNGNGHGRTGFGVAILESD